MQVTSLKIAGRTGLSGFRGLYRRFSTATFSIITLLASGSERK